MTITNGYATLPELRQALERGRVYTASTIAFVNATSKITDGRYGLKRFLTGGVIEISGSANNDGVYNIAAGAAAGEIVTTEALTDEAAGEAATITEIADPIDDSVLESVIEGVSRAIDLHAFRRFHSTPADETRYYTPEFPDALDRIDDVLSLTTLKTDSSGDRIYDTEWAATDYDLEPFNAALDGEPYTEISIAPQGRYSFPLISRAVEMAGRFGHNLTGSHPAPILRACLLLSEQVYKRAQAIFGVVGTVGGQQIMAMAAEVFESDPHIRMMIQPYIKLWVGSI